MPFQSKELQLLPGCISIPIPPSTASETNLILFSRPLVLSPSPVSLSPTSPFTSFLLLYRYRCAIAKLPIPPSPGAPSPWHLPQPPPQGSESPLPVLPFRPFRVLSALASPVPSTSVLPQASERVISKLSSRAFLSICERRKCSNPKFEKSS